jgi:hypothetical protein
MKGEQPEKAMTSNPIPEEYHTDYLFLLIGTNPLPNYVTARLLLKPGGTIYLVHSKATEGIAKRLMDLMIQVGVEEVRRIPIRSGEPDTIYTEVRKYAQDLMNKGRVGLNYTGGTKTMAVHAYRAVEQATQETGKEAVFSYLDANDLSMIIDPIRTARRLRFPISLSVQPSLGNLLHLHNIQLVPGAPLRESYLLRTANSLAALHSTESGRAAWANWCMGLHREDRPDKFKSPGQLKQVQLPTNGELFNVTSALGAEIGLDEDAITLGDIWPKSPWAGYKSRDAMEKIAKWLDGVWLEHYTFGQLQEISTEQNLHPEGMGIGLDTDPDESPYDFEFDVAAIRGYQLFAISCTRDYSESLCKFKLLEAYTRASQLGGEEARVGLVSCHSNPAIVQKEVEDAWGVKERVQVFGYRDLAHLSDKLAEWFGSTP